MKRIFNIAIILMVLVSVVSCEKYLEEEPRSLLTAEFLNTPGGVRAALYSTYSDLRLFYGGESAMSMTLAGTDEWQRAQDGSDGLNLYDDQVLLTNGQVGSTWNWGYTAINTANAVIQFAPTSGLPAREAEEIAAEGRYLRAKWYFLLVQMYGELPLNLNFISEPQTEAFRTPVADVYEAIIDDLEHAKLALPNIGSEPGRADAAAAYHLLARVYLTRATHPTAGQPGDYQEAFNNAMHLINNAGAYELALLQDFGDIHTPRNENNSEVIFNVQRNDDLIFNDNDGNSVNKENRSSFFFRPNYGAIVTGLMRDINYGRPWHRLRPTNHLLDVVFANRTDDTRYDKTFQTVWLVNDEANAATPGFVNGDTAIWLPGQEQHRNARALRIYRPSQYWGNDQRSISIYPSMRKYDDIDRPAVNDASVRPFIVHKFSETYLIAAEAAMFLNRPDDARDLINVVRARAAFHAGRTTVENTLAANRLTAGTPTMADKDEGMHFILDERSRELAGEYMRWFDLVRTRDHSTQANMLLYRLRNLSPAIPARNAVRDHHVLRPIPQSQIDLTTNVFPQNPGYGS